MTANRRTFLAIAAAGLSGCTGRIDDDPAPADDPSEDPAADEPPAGRQDRDTPTPADGSTPTPSAELTLEELAVPDALEVGETVAVSATVGNEGGRPAAVELPLSVRQGGRGWTEGPTLQFGTVAPGAAAEARTEVEARSLPELRVRLGEFEAAAAADVTPAVLGFGKVYRSPGGLDCSVTSLEFAEEYRRRPGESTSVERPGPNSKWALATVRAQNRTDAPATLPAYPEFALLGPENAQYDPVALHGRAGYDGGSVLSGVQRRGQVLFEVPADLSLADLRAAWCRRFEDGGAVVAHWVPEDG